VAVVVKHLHCPTTSTTAMAASSSTLPPLSPAPPQVHRTDSQGSNISAGSVTSLSRRPRTKSRPRAVTVSSRRDRSPASARGLEEPVATTEELLGTTSISPPSTVSPDPSPLPLPSRPARSPLRAASLPKDDISHPDIVPGAGWKAMDDMESSWRSRALKIEHSTVLVHLFLALEKSVPTRFFSSPTIVSAALVFLVMHFVFRCFRHRRLHILVHFSPRSGKCKRYLTLVRYAKHASDFGSQM